MTIRKTFITVTVAALVGLFLGGVFGFAAGKMTPDFFSAHHSVAGCRAGWLRYFRWFYRRCFARRWFGLFRSFDSVHFRVKEKAVTFSFTFVVRQKRW